MPQYTVQQDLFGGETIAGDVVTRMTYVLERYPEARGSYKAALFYFWLEFDGLAEVLDGKAEEFGAWLTEKATSPKTLQNRCMEIQNRRPDLEAPPKVEVWRQRQSRAGRVR
jgi:hypothetical protein